MKLGEFFVKKRLINPAQLEEALRGQLIFGGHLGTCLIEMGFIDEHTLGKTLAEMFGVDYAPPHFLNDIPKSVIDLLPRRLAEKLHAVPFEKKDKSLHVAMIDPKNLPALDELAFATGHRIRPWVSPEARIFQVLERYYEVPRRQRYITVCQDMDHPGADKSGRVATMPSRDAFGSAYAPPPHLAEIAQVADLAPGEEPEQGYGIPSATPLAAKPPAPSKTPAAPSVSPTGVTATPPPAAPSRAPAAAAMPAARPPAPPVRAPETPARPPAPPVSPSLTYARALAPSAPPSTHDHQDILSDLLCAAENASDLAEIALKHATRTLPRSALFLVKGTTATLWRWKANGPASVPVMSISLSVTDDPPFDLLLGREFYQGALPHNPKLAAFYGPLGVDLPSEVVLVPGYLEDRLVVVLYGDGSGGPVRADIPDLDLLVRKLACALQVVLLKKKVRSLERRSPSESPDKAA